MGQPPKPGDAYPVPSSMWLPPEHDLVPRPVGRPRKPRPEPDLDDPFSVKSLTETGQEIGHLDTSYTPTHHKGEKKPHINLEVVNSTSQQIGRSENCADSQQREQGAHALKQAAPEPGPPVLTPTLERLLDERKPYQMTDDEVAVAKFLVSKGYKQSEVCRILDRGRMAVSRAVRSENARECLSRHQRKLAMDWVRASAESARKGHHEAAQAALEAIGAVDVPEAAGKGGGVQVNVGVALPGAGAPVGAL